MMAEPRKDERFNFQDAKQAIRAALLAVNKSFYCSEDLSEEIEDILA